MSKKPQMQQPKRLLNYKFTNEHSFVLHDSLPIYQCKEGGTTEDIEKADLDPHGHPICMGFTDKSVVVDYHNQPNLSFDPSNPGERLRALQSRASMEQIALSPTIYAEKFDAIKKADNAAKAVLNNPNLINNE